MSKKQKIEEPLIFTSFLTLQVYNFTGLKVLLLSMATLSFEAQLALARYQAEMEQIEKKEELLHQQYNDELKKIQDAKLVALHSLNNALQELLEIADAQNVKITIADCSDLQAQIARVRMEHDLQQCSMHQQITQKNTQVCNKKQNFCAIKNVVFGFGVI